MKRLGWALALALACGAARADDGAKPAPAAGPPADANLIIFRAYAEPIVWPVGVRVDGARRATLGNHTYTALTLPPGKHTVALVGNFLTGWNGVTLDVEIGPDKPEYVEIGGTSRVTGPGPGPGTIAARVESILGHVDPDKATHALESCCKYHPAGEGK